LWSATRGLRDEIAGVLDRLLGHRVRDVDEVDGARLLGRGGPREARQGEAEQPHERDAQDHADHPLDHGQIGERLRHHDQEPRRQHDDAEHLRVEELVRDALPDPGDRGVRVEKDEPAVRPEQDPEERDRADDPRGDPPPSLAHTVTLRWYVAHSIAVTMITARRR
jgi:hypothetical protein